MKLKKSAEKKSFSSAQPHDRLARKLLSNPSTVRPIFALAIPEEIRQQLDFDKISLQQNSLINGLNQARTADLIYKIPFRDEEKEVWVLLEHQSTTDPWIPLRTFQYIGAIWDNIHKTAKNYRVPLVLSIVICHGKQPYVHALSMKDMVDPDSFQRWTGAPPVRMLDLFVTEDDVIKQQLSEDVTGVAFLLTLKHVFDKHLALYFEQELLSIFKQLDQSGRREDVSDMLGYLLDNGEFLDKDWFWAIIHREFSSKVEGKVMTIAQQLETQGLERGLKLGIEKGIEKEKRMVAQRLLSEHAELAFIAKITDLPLTKLKELQKKSNGKAKKLRSNKLKSPR